MSISPSMRAVVNTLIPPTQTYQPVKTIEDFVQFNERTRVVAHRGAGIDQAPPGNTLAAFEYAIDAGVDMIELDVRLTKDGAVVIQHDQKYKGKDIWEYTLKEFKEIETRGHHLPTLEETLDALKGRVLINIEIKKEQVFDEIEGGVVQQVIEAVQNRSMESETVISSFSIKALEQAKQMRPNSPTFFVYNPQLHGENPIEILQKIHANGLVVRHDLLEEKWVSQAHDLGYPVSVYVVNDKEMFNKFQLWGVHSIMSDDPQHLKEWVSKDELV